MAELELQPISGQLFNGQPNTGQPPFGISAILEEDGPVSPPPTNPDLFESEMNPHLDALYRNGLRLTGNSNDAEDLLQDTYLRAYRF